MVNAVGAELRRLSFPSHNSRVSTSSGSVIDMLSPRKRGRKKLDVGREAAPHGLSDDAYDGVPPYVVSVTTDD